MYQIWDSHMTGCLLRGELEYSCHAAHASAKKPNLTLAGQEVIDEESITIANAMTLCAFFPVTASQPLFE